MEEETKNKGKKIMLVDDDNFLLDMYSMKFRSAGYQVITCTGAEDSLSQLRAGEVPDVFVFDIIMPTMDGIELYETIISEKLIPDAIKIVLTNQCQIDDKEKIDSMKVDGYIIKALNTPSEVVEKVNNILDKK
jgi:CheY-like chemotaxis protein